MLIEYSIATLTIDSRYYKSWNFQSPFLHSLASGFSTFYVTVIRDQGPDSSEMSERDRKSQKAGNVDDEKCAVLW